MPRAPELNGAVSGLPSVDVIVGILTRPGREVLIARRPPGKHMAGAWEFPGGKLEPGEASLVGLKRELAEELGIGICAAEPLTAQSYRYPDRLVRLDVWWVLAFEGSPRPHEGQTLRWVAAEALASVDMLPADAPIVAVVRERLARA